MGALSKLASKGDELLSGLRRSGDDVQDLKRAAASDLNKSIDDLTDAEFQRYLETRRFADELNSGLSGRQKFATALAGIGGGAYAVGEWQKAEAAEDENEQSQAYQDCIAKADRLEATGQISKEEADQRRERCYQIHKDSNGGPQTITEWLGTLNMVELAVLGLASAWVLVSVLPSLVAGIMDSGKMQEVLG